MKKELPDGYLKQRSAGRAREEFNQRAEGRYKEKRRYPDELMDVIMDKDVRRVNCKLATRKQSSYIVQQRVCFK